MSAHSTNIAPTEAIDLSAVRMADLRHELYRREMRLRECHPNIFDRSGELPACFVEIANVLDDALRNASSAPPPNTLAPPTQPR